MTAAAGGAAFSPGGALAMGGILSIGGAIAGGMDARRQGRRRAAAIEAAQRENLRLANEEAAAHGKAGAIKQGELLNHLRRLADGGTNAAARTDADARAAQIAALAGPDSSQAEITPGQQVAARSAGVERGRNANINGLDLVRALLTSQDQMRGRSARTADVAASRAVIPLRERLYQLSIERMNNQANLQAALGSIGPGWGAVAGQAMQGLATAPLLFA